MQTFASARILYQRYAASFSNYTAIYYFNSGLTDTMNCRCCKAKRRTDERIDRRTDEQKYVRTEEHTYHFFCLLSLVNATNRVTTLVPSEQVSILFLKLDDVYHVTTKLFRFLLQSCVRSCSVLF